MSRCIRFAPGVSLLFLLVVSAPGAASPPGEDDNAFKSTLAVQQAMEQAQHLLLVPDAKKAVDVLEAQLSRINGNPSFLRVLREAYRSYIKHLWLANQPALARKYLERLCIIEPTAAQDPILSGSQRPTGKSTPAFAREMTPPVAVQRPARSRGDDPFEVVNE